MVHSLTEIDRDGDRLDDLLNADFLAAYLTDTDPLASDNQRAWSEWLLDAPALVEFNFTRQITRAELDAFEALGGEVTHVYRAVGYGWNGRLPLSRLNEAVAAMGPGFNGVVANHPISATMYDATKSGGARSAWSLGYTGGADTTIAILDSGLDDSHPDLAGRIVHWKDYMSGGATPTDTFGHGTGVASAAAGTGATGGVSSRTIHFTQSGFTPWVIAIPNRVGPIEPRPVRIPRPIGEPGTPKINWDSSAFWSPTGPSRELEGLVAVLQPEDNPSSAVNDVGWYLRSNPVRDTTGAFSFSGYSDGTNVPYTGSINGRLINTSLFMAALRTTENNGIFATTDAYALISKVSARGDRFFTMEDGHPLMSGVAPASRLAGFRVLNNLGRGGSVELSEALDDLAAIAPEKNIQVANLSLSFPSQQPAVRDKTNSAVNSGVFIAVSAGNEGPSGAMGDPAYSGKAMTIGAATGDNRVAHYSSSGVAAGSGGGRDTIKPDLIAPGGSLTGGQMLVADSNDADFPFGDDQQANDYSPTMGTSFAAPYVSGAAALVIQARAEEGHTWSFDSDRDPLFIKMILAATATETGKPREIDIASPDTPPVNSPSYGGPDNPKDRQEGYGMINVTAAVEAVSRRLLGSPIQTALTPGPTGRRAAGFLVFLRRNIASTFTLTPQAGGNGSFLMCLYSGTPDANGNPVLLASRQSSQPGQTLSLSYTPSGSNDFHLVVKETPGAPTGAFTLAVSPGAGARPRPTTRFATAVTTTSARLNGTMNPGGTPTAGYFEYGPTTAYGHQTQTQLMGSGTSDVSVQEVVTGLPLGATIHYRLVAQVDTTHRVEGADQYLTTWAPTMGDALRFDGIDDAVRIPGFGAVAPSQDITIEFWQKPEAPRGQSAFKLLPDNQQNRLNAHVPWSDGRVYWDFGNIGGSGRLVYTPPEDDPIRYGEWEHWAFAASVAPPRMAIYRNGQLVAGKLSSGVFTPPASDLWLGTEGNGHFAGELDEFRVWNTYRSGTEIEANMRAPLTGNEAGLVAYYPVNDGSGLTLRDARPGGIPGTLVGPPVWVPSGVPAGEPWTLADVFAVLRVAGGLAAPDSAEAAYRADVTRDGEVSLSDAALIVRKIAGLSPNP